VIHPGAYRWIGGFHGKPGHGGPKDNPTGYIAPVRSEILDHDIHYEYAYVLTLGTVDEIRHHAQSLRTTDTRPDFHFTTDRQHWTYHNLADTGVPPRSGLTLRATGPDPYALAPEQWYDAAAVPRLFLTTANLTQRPVRASLFWRAPDQSFDESRSLSLALPVSNNKPQTLAFDLAAHPLYRGPIAALRLDLDPESGIDAQNAVLLRLDALSWRDDPR
jgi:hypothetical protein